MELDLRLSRAEAYTVKKATAQVVQSLESQVNELQAAVHHLLEEGRRKQEVIQHLECAFCLLYTSPSPRDGLLSRMPSSA